jgi:rRNA maturation endonuclease Nob1
MGEKFFECRVCHTQVPESEVEFCPDCGVPLCPDCYDDHVLDHEEFDED